MCHLLSSEKKVLMSAKFPCCMTNDEEGSFIGFCITFSTHLLVNVTVVDEKYYIQLPDNISELNDYMCGPMNRKGRVCSRCIDGFAPSVTSIGYECSNCTGTWYGVPLYLCLEFVPLTVFYLAILVFQISVTSAPMTCCVMYSQLSVSFIIHYSKPYISLESSSAYIFTNDLIILHGIWNLDLFRYIVPPFCVSPNLKSIHISFFGYISAVYPLMLIILTWVCIDLHSHNFKPLVWLWNKLGCLMTKRDSKSTIIDVYATFFLLSYMKLILISVMIFRESIVSQANSSQTYSVVAVAYDTTVRYFSSEHIPFLIAALVSLLLGLLPALILTTYPFRVFRNLLLKCSFGGRSRAALNIFVEKFYSGYRDGLDGGRDMRSFASLYLFVRVLIYIFYGYFLLPSAILPGVCCLLIALVRPYKKTYMNNIDALILALLTLNCIQSEYLFSAPFRSTKAELHLWSMGATSCFPLLVSFYTILPKRLFKTIKQNLYICKKYCTKDEGRHINQAPESDNDGHDPDQTEHLNQYPGGATDRGSECDALLQESVRVLEPVYLSIN